MEQKELFTGNGWIEFEDQAAYSRSTNHAINKRKNSEHFTTTDESVLIFTNLTLLLKDNVLKLIKNEAVIIKIWTSDIRIIFAESESKKKLNRIIWVNDFYKKTVNSTLCGNIFRGESLVLANPNDLAFGDVLEKKCENCFFKPTQDPKRCNILPGKGNMRPRTLFRRRKNEEMPSIIDGKQVAQYCKYFTHWNAE